MKMTSIVIRIEKATAAFILFLIGGLLGVNTQHALSLPEQTQAAPPEPAAAQIFRAPDWTGAVEVGDEGCMASTGEYTLWVYATATQCGVPRSSAERIVVIRQPLPGVAPIRAAARLPADRYMSGCTAQATPGIPGYVSVQRFA